MAFGTYDPAINREDLMNRLVDNNETFRNYQGPE